MAIMSKKFFLICIFGILISVGSAFAQEQLTITTYYPSPYGSYRELGWGDYPNTRGTLSPEEGSSIELGGRGTTPYIDFSNDMTSDYDVRIILTGDDILAVQGGRLTGAVGCRRVTYTASSGIHQCGDWNRDGDCADPGESCTSYLSFVPATGVEIGWWGTYPLIYPSSGWFLCCEAE